MVKKLQKEGSLEPQIEALINRINEIQQAKKKASEELGEAQALCEVLNRELDSLKGEKVHLEEVLSKKQETLRILQLHCQEKESEAQRKHLLQECTEQISTHNSQVAERLDFEDQLQNLMGQHNDLWKFHMLEQRLAREIHTLGSSKEQLLTEERLLWTKLQEAERRLRSVLRFQGPRVTSDGFDVPRPEATAAGPKAELEKFGEQVPTETQSVQLEGAGEEDAGLELPGAREDNDLEPPVELALSLPLGY
ncbi:synaptonemal complex central element protein 1-like [Dasypus novemcinctus]|uniref:synaptonemal complex central element protein 1-like n=1 Tax=Dasypus novemcinctus TaxID=9361 RepID=UPI00265FFE0C|nr:synaptonemal complex central element protein 1-like [Dasypus novemcinctus]